MTQPALLTQWAVCGIAAAAARFVPVPLLDDVVRQRAARFAVVRTVRAHGSDVPVDLLQPLWGDREGSRLRARVRAVSRRVLLFPVRKYAAVFGAVRGVPNDVMRVVLLARTVDRRLDLGELSAADRTPAEAVAIRRAVDAAIDGMDLRLLTAALTDGLSGSRGLSRAAVAFARRRFVEGDPDGTADAALEPDAPVTEGAEQVTAVLRRPEIVQLLERFDAQVGGRLSPGR